MGSIGSFSFSRRCVTQKWVRYLHTIMAIMTIMAPNDRLASRLGIITVQENDFRPFKMKRDEILDISQTESTDILSSQNVTFQWFYFVNCRLSLNNLTTRLLIENQGPKIFKCKRRKKIRGKTPRSGQSTGPLRPQQLSRGSDTFSVDLFIPYTVEL